MSLYEQSERDRARDEFWSEEDEERDRRREVIRGLWMRVNATLLTKRTSEVRFRVKYS
jgi:SIT4-associating protein SAP185/190